MPRATPSEDLPGAHASALTTWLAGYPLQYSSWWPMGRTTLAAVQTALGL